MVDAVAKVVTQKLPVPELALKGFILKAVRDFQMKERNLVKDFENLTPMQRYGRTLMIATGVRDRLMEEALATCRSQLY